jgi:hypothetical protein
MTEIDSETSGGQRSGTVKFGDDQNGGIDVNWWPWRRDQALSQRLMFCGDVEQISISINVLVILSKLDWPWYCF